PEQRIVFVGTGQTERGIADLVLEAMINEGEGGARASCWFFDSKGLVVNSRTDLAEYERLYAHDREPITDLLAAIESVQPTVLIGASGTLGAFSVPVLNQMAKINERPIIFALSTPTSESECTAAQAYHVTGGRALFVSGNPFDDIIIEGKRLI